MYFKVKSHGEEVDENVESRVAFPNYWKRLSFRMPPLSQYGGGGDPSRIKHGNVS